MKRYEHGAVSAALCDQAPGPEHVLELGDPLGAFDARRATGAARLALVAAGTGITPMLRLLSLVLQDPRRAW